MRRKEVEITSQDLYAVCEEINRKRTILIPRTRDNKDDSVLIKALMKATKNGYYVEGLSKKAVRILQTLGGEKLDSYRKELRRRRNEQIKRLVAIFMATHNKNGSIKYNMRAEWMTKPTSMLTPVEWTYLKKVHGRQRYFMRDRLENAARDMNEVMGLRPPIDVDAPYPVFMEQFKEAARMAHGTDNFSEQTWMLFKYHRIGPERLLENPIFDDEEE